MRHRSTASVFSDHLVLLRFAGVVRINSDIRLLALVFSMLPLASVVIVLVRDHTLRAGTLLLTAGIAWSCCILRDLLFANSL